VISVSAQMIRAPTIQLVEPALQVRQWHGKSGDGKSINDSRFPVDLALNINASE
jgi:hypothetical protein